MKPLKQCLEQSERAIILIILVAEKVDPTSL